MSNKTMDLGIDITMDLGIDIIHVIGSDAYALECSNLGVTRLYDAKDSDVIRLHKLHCSFSRERARALIVLVSAFNFNNVSRQVKASYNVNSSGLFIINDAMYKSDEFALACYHLRRLGIKMPMVFADVTKGDGTK